MCPVTANPGSHIRAKIADLRRMERTLAATAARCEGGDAPECPILDALAGEG
jgi:MerR family mercuric resistance operon transcriptional regulator